ncbi:MAG: hypothetical protein F4Y58_04665 [Gammaproteobacteria bacterium]|nr:hypothetical protein [Gammaproteobacteria bacterium]
MAVNIDSAVSGIATQVDKEEQIIDDLSKNLDPSNTADVMKLQMEYSKYSMEEETVAALVSAIKKMIDNITQRM